MTLRVRKDYYSDSPQIRHDPSRWYAARYGSNFESGHNTWSAVRALAATLRGHSFGTVLQVEIAYRQTNDFCWILLEPLGWSINHNTLFCVGNGSLSEIWYPLTGDLSR